MLHAWFAFALFYTDLFVKKYVDKNFRLKEEKKLFNEKITITKYYNKGAMLNLFSKNPRIVTVISQGVMVVLASVWVSLLKEKGNRGAKLGATLLLAGGMNNLWDRLTKGYVVDYFSFNTLKGRLKDIVFNLSDFFIFIGGISLVLFHKGKHK